jgi:shikimate dehydrogenase
LTQPYSSFGLIGYPLGHSLSPDIHTAALHALGMQGEYRLYPIQPLPAGEAGLALLVRAMRQGAIHGLNVTIPHKESLLGLVDDLSPSARAIGAVNTLVMRASRLLGENTDGQGFSADLKRCFPALPMPADSRSRPAALVLGAGGSARAVVYTLLAAGWEVVIAARRLDQAQSLASAFSIIAPAQASRSRKPQSLSLEGSSLKGWVEQCDREEIRLALIVNTTPLGMHPNLAASPWPKNLDFPSQAVVYDLIYNPSETRLMQQARREGLQAFSGLGMLVEQAALAFEIWTGRTAPRRAMYQAASDTIGKLSARA